MISNVPSKRNVRDTLANISNLADVGAVLTVALMVALGIASYEQVRSQQNARQWVLHTYEVLGNLQQARADHLLAELSARKFFDTNSPDYIQTFQTASKSALAHSIAVHDLVKDNPSQLISIGEQIDAQKALFKDLGVALDAHDQRKLIPMETQGTSIQIGKRYQLMIMRERQLLFQRTDNLNAHQHFTFTLIAGVSAFAVLMQSLFAAATRYWTRKQRKTEQQLKATLNSMGEGLAQIDLAGNLMYLNPAALYLLGYSMQEVIGKNMHDLVHYLDVDGQPRTRECGLRKVIETGSVFTDKNDVFVKKDGTLLPVEYLSSPLVENDDMITGAVVCFSDITERLAVDKRLREFYSIVSHELRTPLTSIRAAFGLLEGGVGGNMTVKGKHLISIGRQESDRLVRLINNILDVKKIESGKLDLHIVDLKCADLVRDCIQSMTSFAEASGVSLMASVPDNIEIAADADRTTQVLTNLLSNAVKFSRDGSMVSVNVTAPRGDQNVARFEIKDFGPGIPDDKLSLLFGMFQQVDSTDARSKGGTGLGLAISKAIVESHGGKIGVESVVGQGSTFWFTMPLAGERPSTGSHTSMMQVDTSKKLVLMVDDDQATCEVVKQKMDRHGFECLTATNGHDAIQMAKQYRPQLIVLDVLMDNGSGFDVVSSLTKDEECKATPLVVFTAKDLTEEDKVNLKLGNTAWLIKSRTSDEELEQTVVSMLNDGSTPSN